MGETDKRRKAIDELAQEYNIPPEEAEAYLRSEKALRDLKKNAALDARISFGKLPLLPNRETLNILDSFCKAFEEYLDSYATLEAFKTREIKAIHNIPLFSSYDEEREGNVWITDFQALLSLFYTNLDKSKDILKSYIFTLRRVLTSDEQKIFTNELFPIELSMRDILDSPLHLENRGNCLELDCPEGDLEKYEEEYIETSRRTWEDYARLIKDGAINTSIMPEHDYIHDFSRFEKQHLYLADDLKQLYFMTNKNDLWSERRYAASAVIHAGANKQLGSIIRLFNLDASLQTPPTQHLTYAARVIEKYENWLKEYFSH